MADLACASSSTSRASSDPAGCCIRSARRRSSSEYPCAVAAARRKLIVVSNRGPVSYARGAEGNRVARRGGGGLVTALRGLVSHHDVTWVASAMSEEDRAVADEAAAPRSRRRRATARRTGSASSPTTRSPTTGTTTSSRTRRSGSSSTRCGTCASPDIDLGLHSAWFNGYVPVNEAFAGAVIAELERSPSRPSSSTTTTCTSRRGSCATRCPDALLAHFVHIPWPQSDYWTVLPRHLRQAVHHGLLANDVVGFHTDRWRRNFIRSCEDVMARRSTASAPSRAAAAARSSRPPDLGGRSRVRRAKESPAVLEEERRLVEARPQFLVLRVDRTDPSKNVVRGFRSFGSSSTCTRSCTAG